jgi:hypothetical protein
VLQPYWAARKSHRQTPFPAGLLHRRWDLPLTCQGSLRPIQWAAGGTFGAHDLAIYPELMRTGEIATAGQRACSAYQPRSASPWHKTRPTDRLTWRSEVSPEHHLSVKHG